MPERNICSLVTNKSFKNGTKRLEQRIESSVSKLNRKMDSSVTRLDQKIDSIAEGLNQKIDSTAVRLDYKIDNVALFLLKTQDDVDEIKRTMATKKDVLLILNRIDHFAKRMDVFGKKIIVHDYRLNQLEEKVFGKTL